MAFFVEYDPDNKVDRKRFYNKYKLIIRKSVFSDVTEIARINTARRGERGNYEEEHEYFKKRFEDKRLNKNEFFIASLIDRSDSNLPEKIVGYSFVEHCDFKSEEYKDYKNINTPSGWYLLGLGVYSEYRRLGIGSKLTEIRMQWAKENSDEKKVYFYTNPKNITSQEFHKELGFKRIDGEWFFKDRPVFKTILFEIDI